MKKHTLFFVLLFGLASLVPAYCQTTNIWPWPWLQMEEYSFHFLPVGGWNNPGAFSPYSMALGETYLCARNSTAGFLNPAYLSYLGDPQFSLSYRYTENRYKSSSWMFFDLPVPESSMKARNFRRKTDSLDSAGLVLPFDNWVLAANYFLFQEYNFPEIKGPYWGYPQSVIQSGDMKGLNIAFSSRLTETFALGASVSYVFGDVSRVQEFPGIYIIQNDKDRGWTIPYVGQNPSVIQNYAYEAKGLFFNLGFTWEPSRQVILGFSLRPPFSLDLQAEMEFTDVTGQKSYFSEDNYFKHPLVAVTSLLFHPQESFHFLMDLSYWGWGEFSTDIDPGWIGRYDFRSVVKLNLGAEYKIGLPFALFEALSLRAGFIYDPQPYKFSPGIARDYVTFGFSLPAGRLDFQFAAKLGLSAKEKNRFHSDVLQVGAGYRF